MLFFVVGGWDGVALVQESSKVHDSGRVNQLDGSDCHCFYLKAPCLHHYFSSLRFAAASRSRSSLFAAKH